MRIENLSKGSTIYTANVYLVRGDWNALDGVNTLVDVGRDPDILKKMMDISYGLGKKKIDQVILTHSHYDHATILPMIKELFNPVVYAYSPYLKGVDIILKTGENIKIGDKSFEIIHTPLHSSDSICLYCQENGIFFVGDTPVRISTSDEIYPESYYEMLKKIFSKNIQEIYPGHGDPIIEGCKEIFNGSLINIEKAIAKQK